MAMALALAACWSGMDPARAVEAAPIAASGPAEPSARAAPVAADPAAASSVPGPAAATRPRIGLVLSGGGARGGAHLGVLKVLRDLRVPVDIVVGTSAGSIIGAAYASGMTIEEIEGILRPLRTATLFHDVDRADLPLRRKADDRDNLIGPEFGINEQGLALPKAAVSGVALEAVLRRLTARQRAPAFDDLPIPFRAVATDVVTGEMVVLGRGSLSTAVRASMALPAIVNPVVVDGRLLVDGGVARNLPVDVARAMGAQVVIAVNISTPLRRREELTSALSVSDQMVRLLTDRNIRESLASLGPQDVLISPELGDIATGDFDRLLEAAATGEAAAHQAADALARLAVAREAFGDHEARRQAQPVAPGRIAAVRIEGTLRVNPEVVRAGMATRPGEPLDPATLEADLKHLYARGDFEHVGYRLDDAPPAAATGAVEPRPEGHALVAELVEKSWGPHYLRLGLGLSSDFKGNSTFDLLLHHRRPWLNALGGEWRNRVQFGHVDALHSEWHQPLNPGQQVFAAAHAELRREPFDIYLNDLRVGRFRIQSQTLGLELGVDLGGMAEVRAGVRRGKVRLDNDTGLLDAGLLIPPADTATAEVRLRMDTLDSLRFPRRGAALDARYVHSLRSLGADQPYRKIDLAFNAAASAGAHSLRLGAYAQQGVGNDDLPGWEVAHLGGFLRLSGFRTGQLLGTGARLGRLVYTWRVAAPGLLDGTYLGASAEVGRVSDGVGSPGVSGTLRSNAVFLAADTLLGPVYLGMGFAAGGHRTAYLYLGLP